MSKWGRTEIFVCISLLLVLGSLPSGKSLPCWELMLSAGSQEILRLLRPVCNICVMLPLLGNVNREAAEVLVGLQHARPENWSVWPQCSRNQNQKERLQVWQNEIRDVPQSWRRNLLFPHCINHLHQFPLLLDMVVSHSLALSCHLQIFFATCTSFPAYEVTPVTILFHLPHQEMMMAYITHSRVF